MPVTLKATNARKPAKRRKAKAAPLNAAPAPRRRGKATTETTISLVSAAGLNEWLTGYCYSPKGGKSTKLRLDRDKFAALCKANSCWGERWDDAPNGRLRMIGGIALRRRLDAGEPFNVPAV